MELNTEPFINTQHTFNALKVTLLDEAAERSEAGARADHDDGRAGFEREAEL